MHKTQTVQTTHYNIQSDKLLSAITPITLALLTDTHDKPHNTPDDALLTALKHSHPDLILIAGDFLYGRMPEDEKTLKMEISLDTQALFRCCADTAPTYVSLGNHEFMLNETDLRIIRDLGVTILDNQFVQNTTTLSGTGLVIGGLSSAYVSDYRRFKILYKSLLPNSSALYPRHEEVRELLSKAQLKPSSHNSRNYKHSYPYNYPHNYLRIPEYNWLDDFEKTPGFHILLCHHPEYWSLQEPRLCERKIECVVSGHAHGGEWRFYNPLAKRYQGVFAPGQGLFPKYTEGLHRSDSSTLVISRGLANTTRIPRLGNPLELVVIKLNA